MCELPRGTVTFLFTDIEGSTRLLDELGAEGYGAALAEHRRVLREAFERHGGVEVDTQGDAFFVAFPTAPGALEAAREAQSRAGVAGADGPPHRHAAADGGGLRRGRRPPGRADRSRGARPAGLVSAATAALVGAAELRDLGEHRLKDLSAPERIFQLGDGEFPPLKTLYRTNLPIPATPFLGRDHELAEVRELLARDDARLLTLTGAGGVGEDAARAAGGRRRCGGVPGRRVVGAACAAADPADVGPAAARALGGGGTLPEVVDGRRLLLLLDNFEHVVEAAPEVAAVLAGMPATRTCS